MSDFDKKPTESTSLDANYESFLSDAKNGKLGNYDKVSLRYSRLATKTINISNPTYIQYNIT
jgi:hypothetical protein